MQPKPCRSFSKSIKTASVDRIIALEKGAKRKHVKLSRAGTKAHKAHKSFATPTDGAIHCAKRYARTLSHFL